VDTIISGLDESTCVAAYGALDCDGGAEWWPLSRLMGELPRNSPGFDVIWFYGSPGWTAERAPQEAPLEEILDGWARRNRAILGLHSVLGKRLRLVNIEAVAGFEAQHPGVRRLYEALLGWWTPTYQELYQILEGAAWRPQGKRLARPEQLGESQLLEMLDGFIEAMGDRREASERRAEDKLLALLQGAQEGLESAFRERDELNAQLQAARRELEGDLLQRRRQDQQLAARLKEVERARTAEAASLDKAAKLGARLEEVEAELRGSRDAERASQAKLAETQARLDKAVADFGGSQQALRTLQDRMSDTEARLQKALADLADSQAAERALEAKCTETANLLDRSRADLAKALESERTAKARLTETGARLQQVSKELQVVTGARGALERRLEGEREAARNLKAQLASGERLQAGMKAELATLKEECRELEAKNIEAIRRIREVVNSDDRDSASGSHYAGRLGLNRFVPGLRRKREAANQERLQVLDLVRASEWFDANWYRAAYPDVEAAGLDPVEHYLDHGWKEFRDPGPRFSTTYYLTSNIDVAKSGINPLVHFLNHGIVEGRPPRRDGAGTRTAGKK